MNAKPASRKPKTASTKPKSAPPTKGQKSPAKRHSKACPPPGITKPAAEVRDSKQARLIARLRKLPGATIDQMMTLTGWQAHTVRGAISGVLRKKMGLNVTCGKAGESGERLYSITNGATHK